MTTKLEEYREKYRSVRLERRDGVLQVTFHTNGGPLQWGHVGGPHSEFADAFTNISLDPDNRVVILTGTGAIFSGPKADKYTFPKGDSRNWDIILRNGLKLTMGLLNIEAPIISCLNGPAQRHAEMPLLADIVLAAEDASIQDGGHFINRVVPGDGMQIFMPLLMGWNRARYFLLTGQTIHAPQLKEMGLVHEVMPREQLLPRAWEHAENLLRQNPLVLRYTRMVLTQQVKKLCLDNLGFGLALEGLAAVDESSGKVGYTWDEEQDG